MSELKMRASSVLHRAKARVRQLNYTLRGAIAPEEVEIAASGLFDPDWYLKRYEDVRAARLEPMRHFIQFGWRERRDPNALFDTRWYTDTYPDVEQSGLNPLLHYIRHGAVERRDTGPNFKPSIFQDARASRGIHHLAAALSFRKAIESGAAHSRESYGHDVLIIAELSIAQCRKYRVDQKQELLGRLGLTSSVVNWHDTEWCLALLKLHSTVIFYRVPAVQNVQRYIAEAQRLGLRILWEVDDLIFDPNQYIQNTNLSVLDDGLQRAVLSGVPLYRDAMLACPEAIASTQGLAREMRAAGVKAVHVVENALDQNTLAIARAMIDRAKPRDGLTRVCYGSGTKTHDRDFLEIADGLLDAFRRNAKLRLRIVGELTLPDSYADHASRIERFPPVPFDKYLELLAECDIAIAPLEPGKFNDAKSNIKLLEASALGLPAICSPREAFLGAIRPGETGLLADSAEEWSDALTRLADDPSLRRRIGRTARAELLVRYDPQSIAERQLAAIFPPVASSKPKIRILAANIFFAPRSFGGATIVAEQMAVRLNAMEGVEVSVFTAAPQGVAEPYKMVRYTWEGIPVFAVSLPETLDPVLDFDTSYTLHAFRETLRFVQPDVVHIHSIQGLGARLLDICEEEAVPTVVTLHDAWWICGRQFMVTGQGKYCFQRKIDLNVCSTCVSEPGTNVYRQFKLRQSLQRASLLLTPSDFFTALYKENVDWGVGILTNKNGVKKPGQFSRTPTATVRLGFVGGNADIKGAHLIKAALQRLVRTDYELVLIDNMMSLGFSSIDPAQWGLGGRVRVLPAYTQETMDDFFSQIDVLLFPTQWKESFGLTVREALSRDVWVIATDAGGVVEDMVAGENGTIIPLMDDGTALSLAIDDVLNRRNEIIQHVNPYKDRIADYDSQALQLLGFLTRAAEGGPSQKAKTHTMPQRARIGAAADRTPPG